MEASFSVTNVYGPCDHASKLCFLDSLRSLADSVHGPWIILGDFNLIRFPHEKSNDNFNNTEADWFNDFINTLCFQDIPLLDRLYTWANNQDHPMLCRLDRALVNLDWSNLFPDTTLSSNTQTTSDHVPIVLNASTTVPKPSIFRFNNHWLYVPSFPPIVAQNWESVNQHGNNSATSICLRLKRIRNAAKKWGKERKNPSVLVTNCGIIVDLLDRIEELRPLVSLECRLRLLVKKSLSNNTSLLAEYWKQRGKVRDCVLGDDNTKYFQMCATIRLRKNQIRVLDPEDTPVYSHSGKEKKSYMTSTTTF